MQIKISVYHWMLFKAGCEFCTENARLTPLGCEIGRCQEAALFQASPE